MPSSASSSPLARSVTGSAWRSAASWIRRTNCFATSSGRSGVSGSSASDTMAFIPAEAGAAVKRSNGLPRQTKKPAACAAGFGSAGVGRGLEAFALHALAQQLAMAPHRLGLLARPALRRLLVIPPQLHFPEDAL